MQKKKKKIYVFGRIGRIPYYPMILHNPMYDSSAILNVLVRWDCKIVRSYDPYRDFDNHE